MNKINLENKSTERMPWKKRVRELTVRAAKSVFFWSMAGILAAASWNDIEKLADGGTAVVSGTVEDDLIAQDGTPMPEESDAPDKTDMSDESMSDKTDSSDESMSDKTDMSDELMSDKTDPSGEPMLDKTEPSDESMSDKTDMPDESIPDESVTEPKRAALTFDDGPHPVYTEELLDGLAQRQVKATFFVIGENISGNEDIIARMAEEGHLIGNHTYDHVKICDMSGEEACEQVEKTSALIKEITGMNTEFVRPPFGAWNNDMECSFTMIPVLWDVDPMDWTTKNADLVAERVLKETEDGDIILLHDYYESSVKAALQIVDALQAQGYEFVTVDKLILD